MLKMIKIFCKIITKHIFIVLLFKKLTQDKRNRNNNKIRVKKS